jgi:hypothetical protein
VIRYVSAAAMLGVGWFVVLLVPKTTREFLLQDAARNLAFLAIASVIIAVAFRKFIAAAETFGGDLVRALILPYAGTVVYLSLVAGAIWTEQLLFGGLANLHDTLSLYAMGLVAAILACLVVVPYGLLCQYVMRSAAERGGGASSLGWPG